MIQRYIHRSAVLAASFALAVAPALAASLVDTRTIYLDMGQPFTTVEADYVLDEIVAVVKPDPSLRLTVTGHTDTTGSETANLRLSAARAQEVANYFIARGIAASRITVIGKGESEPAMNTGDDVREPLNRRVVIEVTRP